MLCQQHIKVPRAALNRTTVTEAMHLAPQRTSAQTTVGCIVSRDAADHVKVDVTLGSP